MISTVLRLARNLHPAHRCWTWAAGLGLVLALAGIAAAQPPDGKLSLFPELGGPGDSLLAGPKVSLQARIEAQNGGPAGELVIVATILDDWHIYSTTQPPGGSTPTKISLNSKPKIAIKGPFKAEPAPKLNKVPEFSVPLEEHVGKVTWRAPVTLPAGIDPQSFQVQLEVHGQVCKQTCELFSETTKVSLVGFNAVSASELPSASPVAAIRGLEKGKPGPFRPVATHASIDVGVNPIEAKPGATINVAVTATPDPKYHVYRLTETDSADAGINKPTVIGLELPKSWTRERAAPDREPDRITAESSYYDQKVTWSIPVKIPADAPPGDYALTGFIGFQICDELSCEAPTAAQFQAVISIGGDPSSAKVQLAPAKYLQAADWAKRNAAGDFGAAQFAARVSAQGAAPRDSASVADDETTPEPSAPDESPTAMAKFETQPLDGATSAANLTIFTAIGLAFVGGFLLNFMPCVLPVIGLKVLSFVSQSQGSRKQIFVLNLTYSLGIISVFLALAAFSVFVGLGWGEQFNSPPFTIFLTCLVFAFALSMLGVWEIPIPGFAGSGSAAKLAAQEGPVGAFSKGILTTLLATPCTGPFMGSALTWSIKQPPAITFLTFAALGFGMASPYLVIGVFPRMVKFLPKPGMWMETFKQVMGFVLLATVAFMFSFLKSEYVAATFGLLVGIWGACWWIGRTSVTAEIDQKLKSWLVATLIATGIGLISFRVLVPHKFWQDYSPQVFEASLKSGNIVLVDFTAEWCLVCKVNEATALNTTATNRLLDKHGVKAFRADYTGEKQEIAELMDALGHTKHQLPLYAVFPGPGKPVILFEGPITSGTMARAIDKAVTIRDQESGALMSGITTGPRSSGEDTRVAKD